MAFKVEDLIKVLEPLADMKVRLLKPDGDSWKDIESLDELQVDGKYIIEPTGVGFQILPRTGGKQETTEVICPRCKKVLAIKAIPDKLDGTIPPPMKEIKCSDCGIAVPVKLPEKKLN